MTASTHPISPLRQRMIDDMRMRKLSPKTQSGYIRAVRQFAAYLGRSPDTASTEDLRNYQLHLVDQGTDVIDRVVGGGIEFMDIIRTLLVECLAGFAFVTGFPVGSRIQTIDRLGKDTGTRSLAHSTGTAKEVGMSQLVTLYCILKCSCQGLLAYHTTKSRRTVFPCRNYIIIHS